MANANRVADLIAQAADLIECNADALKEAHSTGHKFSDHLAQQNYLDELTVAHQLRRMVRQIPPKQRTAEKMALQALEDAKRMLLAGSYQQAANFAFAANSACETLVLIKESKGAGKEAAA